MYRYGFSPVAASWPPPRCARSREAVTHGKSIADKHAEIVSQFQQIANAKGQLGLDCDALHRLENAFFSTYRKATSGYWGGGLWDGVYRYAGNTSRPGPYWRVGEQLNDHDVGSLTPSARRFSAILGHLTQALRKEQEILAKCLAMAQCSVALGEATFDDPDAQRTASQRLSVERADGVAEIERCLAGVRESIALASKEVWPEQKHFGKRLVITTSLYSVAAAVAVAGLFVSGGILGIVATVMTLVIRAVSLGSIRGFDRERGWKSVESLLASTKQFIETEGTMMRTYLDVADRRAALEREDMVWNLLKGIKSDLGQVGGRVDSLDSRVGSLSNQMETVANRLDDRADTLTDQVNTLTGQVDNLADRFDGFTDQFGSLIDRVDTLTGRVDTLANRFDTLTTEVNAGFASVDDRFKNVDTGFDSVDTRFDSVGARFDSVGARFDSVDARFDSVDARFDSVDTRFDSVDTRFNSVDARLDGFRSDLQRLSRAQESMAARLAMAPYPLVAAPAAERRELVRTNSLSALGHAMPRMA
ncbi:Chromosome partition protein Smc [Pandoraea terrigena]|uniref:Chromosome partition protein Smc n=2 Tax=Pandoraea terrigena TaxID=2508292 RepID=A0A5E4TTH1_9BURK|nr:Chromosome partition protein Smc [Pandoraea terrigena]